MSNSSFNELSIGQRIKHLREARRYTQRELGNKAGVGQAAISNLETDSSRKPSARTLLRLADALDCNPNWFLDGMGDPTLWRPVTNLAEASLLMAYRALTQEARRALLAVAQSMK